MKKPETVDDYRDLILSFIASLTMCDHMGDVCDDIDQVLKALDIKIEWEDLHELCNQLGKLKVCTIWGTELSEDEDD